MTNHPTRAVDIRMSDGTIIGKAVWAWGECTIISPGIEARREPRLDSDDDLVVCLMIAAIKNHNEYLEFLWDDYLEAS